MKLTDAVFYHLYPLGALGAIHGPRGGHAQAPLLRVLDWMPALQRIGANALWLGPVFESERHGYDTLDFCRVDGRLGSNADLAHIAGLLKSQGIALVLDAVFNHVGRGHPIVQDVVRHGAASPYACWIAGFNPGRPGAGGLPFGYEGWNGHHDLVKLDTSQGAVREYLIGVALRWMDEYGIAGLRLDAADCIDHGFLRQLGERCRAVDPDFFLIGEAVNGDGYCGLLQQAGLDSVTNYEAGKGLWSSCRDRNLFEIAWTLERLFGRDGRCRDHSLYSFADNHDVDRVASQIEDPAHLFPLYGLMFAMPGTPSVYYGSEFGITGRRLPGDDTPLRPVLDPADLARSAPAPGLPDAIARFAAARRASPAVRSGDYRQLHVASQSLAFLRRTPHDLALIVVNIAPQPSRIELQDDALQGLTLRDRLDPGFTATCDPRGRTTMTVPPNWLRWLRP